MRRLALNFISVTIYKYFISEVSKLKHFENTFSIVEFL